MKPIRYIVDKEDGKPYTVLNPELRQRELDALPKGRYRETIEKFHRKATHLQFSYLYSVCYPLSMVALNDAGYEFVNVDQVDLFWKSMFANKEVMNRETGEVLKIPLSKSEFVTIQEMTYCNAIRNYCSEYLNANIPDPDPNWKQKQQTK